MDAQWVFPREVPDRDSKYMGIAWMIAGLSKDPSTQIGALIINEENEPLGWGYNGPPAEIKDDSFSWERPGKYDLIQHAEENAIDHTKGKLKGATIYVTGVPCKKCMLRIVKKQITKVVYLEREYDSNSMQKVSADVQRSLEIARMAGIEVVAYHGPVSWIGDWVERGKELGVC